MANTIFVDEPRTVELLQSMRRLMEWLSAMPSPTRRRFFGALAECSDEVQRVVFRMVSIVEDPHTKPEQRQRALATIADALALSQDDDLEKTQEAAFADRLHTLMAVKCVTQHELAERVGCSQPAISQMLNRKSRPQKKTILKLAEALQVQPQELWPDLEVAEMLDAVAGFQEDDHAMTEVEAKALRDASKRNAPKIPVRSLPGRGR